MQTSEYMLRNVACKKTEATLSNIIIVKNAIKEFAYSHYKGSYFYVDFFGKIDKDFRALVVIGEMHCEDAMYITKLPEFDKKFNFDSFDIKEILKVRYCRLLKLDQNDILKKNSTLYFL